ncbi:MAG: nitrogen fixation protein FixH [Proteobacteria bacterium]|nr:nitrogen fixation protein FixH [Pseudomonadota bacterium]
MTDEDERKPEPPGKPWWRHGMVWLVISGPLIVVVAGIVTAVIAVRGADALADEPNAAHSSSEAPALKARNHAATPAEN